MARLEILLPPMLRTGIRLTSVRLHHFWETIIHETFPTELPRPRQRLPRLDLHLSLSCCRNLSLQVKHRLKDVSGDFYFVSCQVVLGDSCPINHGKKCGPDFFSRKKNFRKSRWIIHPGNSVRSTSPEKNLTPEFFFSVVCCGSNLNLTAVPRIEPVTSRSAESSLASGPSRRCLLRQWLNETFFRTNYGCHFFSIFLRVKQKWIE